MANPDFREIDNSPRKKSQLKGELTLVPSQEDILKSNHGRRRPNIFELAIDHPIITAATLFPLILEGANAINALQSQTKNAPTTPIAGTSGITTSDYCVDVTNDYSSPQYKNVPSYDRTIACPTGMVDAQRNEIFVNAPRLTMFGLGEKEVKRDGKIVAVEYYKLSDPNKENPTIVGYFLPKAKSLTVVPSTNPNAPANKYYGTGAVIILEEYFPQVQTKPTIVKGMENQFDGETSIAQIMFSDVQNYISRGGLNQRGVPIVVKVTTQNGGRSLTDPNGTNILIAKAL